MDFPKEWLKEKVVSIEDLEREHTRNGVVFGGVNQRWLSLKEQMQPGDELWFFNSDQQSWASLAGRAGFVIMRNGEAVASMVTVMS